jgi:hypothetical protein
MVAVPYFCPDVPPLKKNPVFMYFPDRFEKPNPFRPDVAVSIDAVAEKKLAALGILESQFAEGGALGNAEIMPNDPAKQQERRAQVSAALDKRDQDLAERFRSKLVEFYGQDKGGKVQHAEAFEICEYGSRPNIQELKKLFPFFDE